MSDPIALAEYFQSVVQRMDETLEHAAQCLAIHVTSMHTKADDPARVLIHHDGTVNLSHRDIEDLLSERLAFIEFPKNSSGRVYEELLLERGLPRGRSATHTRRS